jgi:hypothetical protein
MLGILGLGAKKWFLVTIALPATGTDNVGSMQMQQMKDETQCVAAAKTLTRDAVGYYACMNEEDYGLLLKYGQRSPVFKVPAKAD